MLVQEALSRELARPSGGGERWCLTGSPDESGTSVARRAGSIRHRSVPPGMHPARPGGFSMSQKDSALAQWFYARTKNAPTTRKNMTGAGM